MTAAATTTADVFGCAGRIQNIRWSNCGRRTERPGGASPTPLVSVIVPTHNRPEMLAEALASVRAQTFTDYEILVISNGEGTAMQVASEVAACAHGARYFTLREANASAARNFAIARAGGEWIAFLDDDDLWLPEKLECQIEAARDSGADMIVCGCVEFHADGRESLRQGRLPTGWTHLKAICHQKWIALPSTVIVRRSAIEKAGGFDPELRVCEDGDLWRRIAWNHTIHEIDEPLARHRKHAGAVSEDKRKMRRGHLRHAFKMLRDTPEGLRHAVPSLLTVARRMLLRNLMPRFLRRPRKFPIALLTPSRPG